MSEQTTLRQADNVVTVEGLVKEIRIEEADVKGKEAITGEIDIEVKENETHTFRVFSYKLKGDGTENGLYKGLLTVKDEYKSIDKVGREEADKVRINRGQLGVNEYYGQDGMLRSFPQLSTNFINRLQAGEELKPKAEFEVEAVVKAVRDEYRNEEETGRALVDTYIPVYGGKVIPFTFVVADEGAADYIKDNYESGSTVKIYGDIINHIEVKEVEEAVAFGKPQKKITRKTTREYVITGGSEPYEEDSSKVYDTALIKKALTERELQLEELKNKKNESKPKEEKKGFDTKSSSKKTTLKEDDLPF